MSIQEATVTQRILADLAELKSTELLQVINVASRELARRRAPEEKNLHFRLSCHKAKGRPQVSVLRWDWIGETISREPVPLTIVDQGAHWYATGQLFLKQGDVIEQFPLKGENGYAVIFGRQVVHVANITAIGRYLRCELELGELIARKDHAR